MLVFFLIVSKVKKNEINNEFDTRKAQLLISFIFLFSTLINFFYFYDQLVIKTNEESKEHNENKIVPVVEKEIKNQKVSYNDYQNKH